MQTKFATDEQLDYFEVLWSERTDADFDREKFAGRTSREMSALIQQAMRKPSLPVTDAVSDEIVALSQQLGITVVVQPDRARANRQLRDLRTRVNRAEWNEALKTADGELDELFAGEPADADDLPF